MYKLTSTLDLENSHPYSTGHAQNMYITRMYSSGMRTARLLTISQHALRRGGVCIPACTGREVCIPACTGQGGGCIPACIGQGGVCPGGVWQGVCPPGVCGRVCPGGVCLGVVCMGCVPRRVWQTPPRTRGRHPPCEQNDRQV